MLLDISARRLRAIVLCLLLLVFTGVLYAGGAGETDEETADADSLVLTDQTGRSVAVVPPVERIVTIPIPAASMMIALDGGTQRLAGMHPQSKTALMEGVLGRFYPDAVDIPSEIVGDGFMPSIESLVRLDPDLVFQWGHQGAGVVEPLTNAGINTALLLYGTQEYLEGWIDMFGRVLDKQDKADRIIEWHHQTMQEISERVTQIPESERPRVVYFLRWLSHKSAAADGTYNDFYIGFTGGINPASGMQGFPQVNEEQIIEWDPEVILLNGFESDLHPDHVYENQALADVSAVKNRRVYKIPLGGYRWDPPNQESPLLWKWLSMILHPDHFSYDLRTEIVEAYAWIYGHVPSDEDLDEILRIKMNDRSSGYDVFNAR
jgi:iron complex transport system substrate-binding protein